MSALRILQLLVIANSVLLVIQSVRVIAVYSAVFTLTKGSRRQLPLHVWLIALSYLIYSSTTGYYLFSTPIPNAYGRTLLYGTAGIIGQYALFNVLSYERRKYTEATNYIEPDAP